MKLLFLLNNQYIKPYIFAHTFCKFKEECLRKVMDFFLPVKFGGHAHNFEGPTLKAYNI